MENGGGIHAFIRQIARLVKCILNLTLDALCATLALAACALPWRIPQICAAQTHASHKASVRSARRKACAAALGATIADGLGLACFAAAPTRWPENSARWRASEPEPHKFDFTLRCAWISNFFLGLVDLAAIALALVALVSPFRTAPFLRGARAHVAKHLGSQGAARQGPRPWEDVADGLAEASGALTWWAWQMGLGACLDWRPVGS